MNNIEILDTNKTLEEVIEISKSINNYTKIDNTTCRNNIILTSLFVGASLMPYSSLNANAFNLHNSTDNQLITCINYNNNINKYFNGYIGEISEITKRQITKKSIVREILSFKSLSEKWDGFSALPLEVESATNAMSLIDYIGEDVFCTVTNYYPNPNGTITFEWENNENEVVSVEVGNQTFSYFVDMSSMETKFFNNVKLNAKNTQTLSKYIQAI